VSTGTRPPLFASGPQRSSCVVAGRGRTRHPRWVTEPARPASRLTRRLLVTLSIATGVAAANLYYAQPLLHTIADRFGASESGTGLIVTGSQVGYAVGLAFLVPAGDLFDRRRLVPRMLVGAAAMLGVAAAAPNLPVLIIAASLIGLLIVVTQILVPLVAELADDGQRGKAVGTVMTGLLLGILLARTVSGLIAAVAGWRGVYVVGAVLTLALAVVLRAQLPEERPRERLGYGGMLRSAGRLARTEPELRRSATLGSLAFATFSVFWTTIAFRLADAPFEYSDSAIGLLGLVGAAGAVAASAAGRLADRGLTRGGRLVSGGLLAASFAVLWLGRDSIAWIVVGVVVLDLGVQGTHILNQSTIYEIAPDARSRINAVYMTSYFVGGALGSAAGAFVYDQRGWGAVCILGAALGIAAVGIAARRPRVAAPVDQRATSTRL
jgi:predicted MFS family arabinose efflux permease